MRGLVIYLVLASSACAGTIDDDIADARYREYGETFAPYTARIVGVQTDDSPAFATCTLVAPEWALTAAHVVEEMAHCCVVTGTAAHKIDRIVVHPEYVRIFADDIALVHVETPFALKRYPPLTDGTEAVGSVCAAAGYGVTGKITVGFNTGDAEIRAGTMVLDYIEGTNYICRIDRGRSPLPFAIAPGDSGGGLYAAASDGRTVLVGVNSFTSKRGKPPMRSAVGEESGHTRVAPYLDWIHEVAGIR